MDIRKILLLCIILIFGGCFLYSATPQKTYVVANLSLKDSVEVAQAYASKRNIPISNIIAFAMPTSLEISKAEYFSKIENTLVAELVKRRAITAVKLGSKDSNGREIYSYVSHDIDFVVFCYGVPYAVRDFPLAKGEKARNGMKTAGAALDSEFSARFIDGNKFFGMLKNPLYKDIGKKKSASLYGLIPTARLDGANKADVLNIIDSAIEAERKGVAGRVYLDKSKKYKLGDDWIDLANKILSYAYFDIDVSEAPALFGCADRMDGLAYYFGWYSRRATGYFAENGFRAARGASALHIYSYSAREMRNRLFWTPALVSAGAVATFGNIEIGFKTTDMFMSQGFLQTDSDNIISFIGFRDSFQIGNTELFYHTTFGTTNPRAASESMISGFRNVYTASAQIGAKYGDFRISIGTPDTIIGGNMHLHVPTGRDINGDYTFADHTIDLATRPSIEFNASYKFMTAGFVDNPYGTDEFYMLARTKLQF